MLIQLKRKEGESTGSFLYRFSTKIKQSGVLKEAKRRRFKTRDLNKRKRKLGALYRLSKAQEMKELKKYGRA